jgi:hypothetical protein
LLGKYFGMFGSTYTITLLMNGQIEDAFNEQSPVPLSVLQDPRTICAGGAVAAGGTLLAIWFKVRRGGTLVAVPVRTVTNSVTRSVDDVNASFVAKGWNAPYSGKTVREFVTGTETQFVRVHGPSNKARSWMMRADDIEGLTPAQIRDKFALPDLPTMVSEVHVPIGTKVRVGKVAPQPGWGQGGAMQYELLERIPEDCFKNTREL